MDEKELIQKLYTLFYVFKQRNRKEQKGMKFRDVMVLYAILQCQNAGKMLKMSSISERFKVTPSAVSQVVKEYEKKGWIERIIPENDRRTTYLKVTREAQNMILMHYKQMQVNLHDFLSLLEKEDVSALMRVLDQAVQYYQEDLFEAKKGEYTC